jgi:hypothetical protein
MGMGIGLFRKGKLRLLASKIEDRAQVAALVERVTKRER